MFYMNDAVKATGRGTAGAWLAGASEADITPTQSQFLFGYPHVKRYSSGVHDPLLASALYLSDGTHGVLFVACDVILVPRRIVERARRRIALLSGIAGENVTITATHTHSGPITASMASNAADSVVPSPDPAYLKRLEHGIVAAAVKAFRRARPARLAFATADTSELGGNRRALNGPRIHEAPILFVHDAATGEAIAVMCVVTMHPTVLHEDWTLVSGDFPGLARRWLQQNLLGPRCPFVYHMGASGDQSPRHVVRGNTIAEATRLGEYLGRAVAGAMGEAEPIREAEIEVARARVELPLRTFPSPEQAETDIARARAELEKLSLDGADRPAIRTAECDVFGAEETLTLARAAISGALQEAAQSCMPAEVQVIRLGDISFVGWPGEVFVEFALEVRRRHPHAHVITLANGDLQGYVVTQQAIDERAYEAGNAIFASPISGERLVAATRQLLERTAAEASAPTR